jgi:hypothetical protein
MIIHHSGVHEDKRERGSNVLRGAADTVIKISRKDSKIDVINRAPEGKQKDAEEFETVKLLSTKVAFETQSEHGEIIEQTTMILSLRDDADLIGNEPVEEGESAVRLGKNEKAILKALRDAGDPLGFTRLKAMTGTNQGSLTRALASLVDKKLVVVEDDKSGNSQLWSLVDSN